MTPNLTLTSAPTPTRTVPSTLTLTPTLPLTLTLPLPLPLFRRLPPRGTSSRVSPRSCATAATAELSPRRARSYR